MEMNASLFFFLFLFDILSLYYIFYNDRRHSLRLFHGNFFYDFPFRFTRLKRDCIIEYTQHWQYRVEMCARYLRHATGNRSNSVFSLLLLFSLWLHAYTHARTHARIHLFFFVFYVWLCIDEIVHIYRTWLQTADVYSFLGNLRFQSADEEIRGRGMTRNVYFPWVPILQHFRLRGLQKYQKCP